MENGGFEAMLHELMHHDYTDVNLRQAPRSEALFEQVLHSLPLEEKWWFETLKNGNRSDIAIPHHENEFTWPESVTSQHLWDSYREFADKITKKYHKLSPSQLINRLKKFCPLAGDRALFQGQRRRGYYIPPLDIARKEFEEYIQFDVTWEEEYPKPDNHGGLEI